MRKATSSRKPLIGWREWIVLPDLGVETIKAKMIHYRSASSVGRWDLGANRQRMQKIVAQFEELANLEGSAKAS